MKKKRPTKKLLLNKTTVSNLNSADLDMIKGGTLLTFKTCVNCGTASCTLDMACCGPTVPKQAAAQG
ncbi:MAG: class I lanthipeptide [Candidatus Aminicenantes bacterium]|nr:class I lanthipeptide [Candidatus Aminicenantes bacterium]